MVCHLFTVFGISLDILYFISNPLKVCINQYFRLEVTETQLKVA